MLHLLLSPLSLGLLIALLLALAWRWLPRWSRYTALVGEFALLVVMAPLGANILVSLIESRVPPVQACKPPTPIVIVVLSGGAEWAPSSADDFSALEMSSLRRLFAAVALWRHTPDAQLVIVGGGGKVPDSVVLAQLAQRLGVPADAIRTEQRSRTTWENAWNLAADMPHLPKRIWLVSSALHLPRALFAFRSAGFEPCAYSSGSLYEGPGGLGYFVPQSSSLIKAEESIHELVGSIVYRLRARRTLSTRAKH